MAPIAGFNCTVKVSGTPTTLTEAACTNSGDDTTYQITTAANRILDPATEVVVEIDPLGDDTWETADAEDYTVDYLFGKVTFGSALDGDHLVRVSGKYLPVHAVAEARTFDLSMTRTELDCTVFGDTARSYELGLKSAEGSIESLDMLSTDLDGGAGEHVIEDFWTDDTPKLLEIDVSGAATQYFRSWVRFPSLSNGGAHDELLKGGINWKSTAIAATGTDRTEGVSFGIGV